MKRKLFVEFNGGDLQTQNVHPMQLLTNDALVAELKKKSEPLANYFSHLVNACSFPQRYKNSEVARLLVSKQEIAAIQKSEDPYVMEAAYRMEELHDELSRPRNYFKLEEKKTPMGQD